MLSYHQIIFADQDRHTQPIRELFWEYLQRANEKVEENCGVGFDIATMLDTLNKFMSPKGCLLLGNVED